MNESGVDSFEYLKPGSDAPAGRKIELQQK
jgi:hypothetical protein